MLLFFAAGSSYHSLCAAQIIECQPCHIIPAEFGEHDAGCKACEESKNLADSAQPTKPADFTLAFVQLAVAVIEQIIFTAPEHLVTAVEPPSTDLPLASILQDIKQSIPIRGPSFMA